MTKLPRVGLEWKSKWRILSGTEASALLEFAVALPLLVVLVVGIFDFGGAFNTKQKLNNAVRDAARYGATQPTNDLFGVSAPPPSVEAIRFAVDAYLKAAKINDCGLDTAPKPGSGAPGYLWTYTANSGCGGKSLQLTIQRAFPIQEMSSLGNTVNVLSTQVIINYPYQWHFNNVIGLLIPGAHLSLVNIQTQATQVNTN